MDRFLVDVGVLQSDAGWPQVSSCMDRFDFVRSLWRFVPPHDEIHHLPDQESDVVRRFAPVRLIASSLTMTFNFVKDFTCSCFAELDSLATSS